MQYIVHVTIPNYISVHNIYYLHVQGAPSGYPKTSSTSLLTNQSPQPPTSNDVTNDYSPPDMYAASSAWKISNSTSLTKPPPLYNMNLGVDSLLCSKSTNDTTIANRDSKSPTTYQWGSGTSSRLGGSGSALDDFMLLRFSGSGASIRSSHCGGDNGSDGLYSLGRKRMMNNIDDSVGPNPKRGTYATIELLFACILILIAFPVDCMRVINVHVY